MKYGSKIAYFLLLVVFGNSSFGMRRLIQLKPMTKTNVLQAPPFYARVQQAVRNAWTNLINRFSNAPAVNIPQSIAFQESPEPILVPIITPTFQRIDQTKWKKPEDIAQEIAPVLKAIELSKKENLPEKKETSLMVCTPPGIEIDYISALQSFDAIKNFLTTQKIRILTEAGLNNEEISTMLLQLDMDQKYIYENAYTMPSKPVIHDTTFDPNILQEIMIKLRQAGINPLCVNIINKSTNT